MSIFQNISQIGVDIMSIYLYNIIRKRGKDMTYKGYEIETFFEGFTVFFEGDEIYFDTMDEAKRICK